MASHNLSHLKIFNMSQGFPNCQRFFGTFCAVWIVLKNQGLEMPGLYGQLFQHKATSGKMSSPSILKRAVRVEHSLHFPGIDLIFTN